MGRHPQADASSRAVLGGLGATRTSQLWIQGD